MDRILTSLYRVSLGCVLLAAVLFSLPASLSADSLDWRSVDGKNWLTPVRSQFGGTCWAFAGVGALESHYMLTRNDISYQPDVSEQQLVWETTPDMGSTGGGGGHEAFAYDVTHGVVLESECPHTSSSEDVGVTPYWPLATGWENRVVKGTNYAIQITSTTDNIKSALNLYGPMHVALAASYDLYSSLADLKTNYSSETGGVDHAVVVVAYYDDATCPTGGYWIIKNSWGYSTTSLTDYGNNGCYLVPYGAIEVHDTTDAMTGPVYYTGAMATVTWKGTTNSTWDTTYANRRNWANGTSNYQWVNQETQANFGTATRKAITISGAAIAHGLNFTVSGYTISSGSLTVTGGGITASESVTINSPVYVGAPQSWNVSSGKTLSITGALHTIISDLTFSGAGSTTISGTIDGGGVLNTVGGVKPGGLIQAGTGVVTLSGATQFSGNITAQTGSGALNIQPPSAASATFDGGFFGGGTINVKCSGVFSLSAAASNFSGTLTMQQPGTLRFIPAAGVTSTFTGVISTSGPIVQDGPGTTILSGSCSYPSGLTIASGTLALRNVTDPSLLAGNFTVNGGTFEFNTYSVDSNYTGVVSGSGGLNKSGTRKLTISGSSGNVYSGDTNILQGSVDLNKSSGYAVPGNLNFSPVAGAIVVRVLGNNQIAPSATVTFNGSVAQIMELLGHTVTVAGFSDANGLAFVENAESEVGDGSTGVLVVDSAANSVFNGCFRDNNGTGTGKLALVKNGTGTLTLSRNRCGMYTGGLTVNDGTLDYSTGSLPTCDYTVTGGALNLGTQSKSIGGLLLSGGAINGSGTLTASSAYNLQNGTINVGLGGEVGLNKSGAGTVALTRSLPGGNYAISGGTLNLGGLSKSIGTLQITGGTVTGTGTLTATGTAYNVQGGVVNVKLAGTDIGLNKTGTGTAVLNAANAYTGRTTVAGGALELATAAQSAVLSLGGADVQSGRLIFDYSGSDPAATIQSLLTASCHGGQWDLGQFRNSTALATGLTLGWLDDPVTHAVTVMATYAGDFNLDGVVNATDMTTLTSHIGGHGNWSSGDANYDGRIDLLDLNLWKSNLGLPALAGSTASAPVPEPGTLALLAVGVVGLLAWTSRRRGG